MMICDNCNCDLEKNIIQEKMVPYTYHYVIEKAFHYCNVNRYELVPDWKETERLFSRENDKDNTEGAHVDKYYCRKCKHEYSKTKIKNMLMKEGKIHEVRS